MEMVLNSFTEMNEQEMMDVDGGCPVLISMGIGALIWGGKAVVVAIKAAKVAKATKVVVTNLDRLDTGFGIAKQTVIGAGGGVAVGHGIASR